MRFDPLDVSARDAANLVTPGRVFNREGFQLFRRQLPQQAADPCDLDARDVLLEPAPLVHRANSQAKIRLGIAPAGVDPGPRRAGGDAARLVGVGHGDACAGTNEMPRDRGPDDARANYQDMWAIGHRIHPHGFAERNGRSLGWRGPIIG